MKTIETANYKKNDLDVYYIDEYHAYRHHGVRNPGFNAFSGRVLDFKDGKSGGINYFLNIVLDKKIYLGDYTIVLVPPSDPARQASHGSKVFLDKLFSSCRIKEMTNGSDCLVRTVKVPKSVSGDRSIKKHLDSIAVQNPEFVKGKIVLLLDDVTTTGNSLLACKKILEKASCKKVVLMALAQTA